MIYIKSFFIGVLIGFLYSFLFVNKIENLCKKNIKHKIFLDNIFVYSALHLIFILLFAFLFFKLRLNILVTVFGFLCSFWGWLLFKLKNSREIK